MNGVAAREASQIWGDLHLRVFPIPGEKTTLGQAVFKITHEIAPLEGTLRRAMPRPLVNDIRDPGLTPRIPPHSDFWPGKRQVDVAVIGAAHAANARPSPELLVTVNAGRRRKVLRVHGRREIRFRADGSPEIGPAEEITSAPLGIGHAYGGLDRRAPHDPRNAEEAGLVAMGADWPGLYPRNPWGRGYLCAPGPVEGLEMPSQEDAGDPLTAERLVAEPRLWYRQPVPAYLDWMPVNCFPRAVFLGPDADPWYPPPDDDTLPEIAAGHLPPRYRGLLAGHGIDDPHWRFRQEAAPGLSFRPEALRRAPITVTGMHPVYRSIGFELPPPPEVRLAFETARETVEPEIASVEILPGDLLVSITYTAGIRAPRLFMPGLHARIPFGVIVDGRGPCWYEAPPTVKRTLAERDTVVPATPPGPARSA